MGEVFQLDKAARSRYSVFYPRMRNKSQNNDVVTR